MKSTMPNLKLAKLPDRRSVKVTVTLSPDLDKALKAYADVYRQSYGEEEEVSALIPYMLEQFLASDRAFVKSVKPSVAKDRGTRGNSQKTAASN
jgi:hypothetical protein